MSACTPNSDEVDEEVEVQTEELISDEIVEVDSISESEIDEVSFEENENDEIEIDKSTEGGSTSEDTKTIIEETKASTSVTINRDLGIKLQHETEFDLMGYAAEEVAILKKENCDGENCGIKIQLQSYNSDKSIVTVVMIKWKEGGEKKSELREYKLKPEALISIGCSHSCDDDNTKYTWKIVSAKYN